MNAVPLLAAKRSTYQGAEVFTAVGLVPVAWACSACDLVWRKEYVADRCCHGLRASAEDEAKIAP